MKNIFKFLSIALVAGALMVACNPDDENGTTDTTGNNPQPQPQPQVEDGYVITMDGASWTAAVVLGRYNEAGVDQNGNPYDAYLTIQANKAETQGSPYVQGFLQAAVVSNGTNESTGGDIMQYRDPNDIYTDNDGVLGEAGGQYYNFIPDPSSFVENVTAVDLNALKISANWTENYLDIPTYIANQGSYTGAKVMSGVLTNVVWTAAK